MSRWRLDFKTAWRSLSRRPGLVLGCVASLTAALLANVLLLGIADRALLRPLAGVPAADRLVTYRDDTVSYPDYRDLATALAAGDQPWIELAAAQHRTVVLGGGAESKTATALVVSGSFFDVVGARVAAGRAIGESDDRAGAPPVVVLATATARELFGEPAASIGRAVRINDRDHAVVGVADPEFRGLSLAHAPALFLPVQAWGAALPTSFGGLTVERRTWGWLTLVGRLAPGVTPERAGELAAPVFRTLLRESLSHRTAESDSEFVVRWTPAAVAAAGLQTRGDALRMLAVFAVAALALLLLAATNVAGLLLSRAEERKGELAMRLALGADGRALARSALFEPALLALGAGAISLALVSATVRLAGSVPIPGLGSLARLGVGVDGRLVLGVGLLVAVTTLACGWLPARAARRARSLEIVRGARSARRRVAPILVAAQVGATSLLVIVAALLARGMTHALAIPTGFDGERLAYASVNLGLARYDTERALVGYREAVAGVEALPGVVSATWAGLLPLSDDENIETVQIPGYVPIGSEVPEARADLGGTRHFATLGVRLVAGRDFTIEDLDGRRPVAVVSRSFVARYFGDGSPLGRRFSMHDVELEIVGVTDDLIAPSLVSRLAPTVTVPWSIVGNGMLQPLTLVARTDGEPETRLAALRSALGRALPGAPVVHLGTTSDLYSQLLAPQRLTLSGLTGAAALGLLLAAVGIFAQVSYSVASRRREIGVRVALGATPRDLAGSFTWQGLRLAGIGLAIGATAAAAIARPLAAWLFGLTAWDPLVWLASVAIVGGVAALASWWPARRAAALEPARVLFGDGA